MRSFLRAVTLFFVVLFAPRAFAIDGLVYIGTGVSSSGDLNVNAAPFSGDAQACFAAAMARGNEIHFLEGVYVFPNPTTVSQDDIKVTGSSRAVLDINHTGAVGLFDVTGDRFSMSDVIVTNDTATANQVYVDVTGDDPTFSRVILQNTGSGSNANPTTYIECGTTSQGIRSPMFRDVRFRGVKGGIFAHIMGDPSAGSTSGCGATFIGCIFGTEGNTPDKLYRGVWFESAGEALMSGCRMHGIGDGTDPADAFIYNTTDGSESEAHHFVASGCNFELFTGKHLYRGDGARFTLFTGCLFGRMGGNASGEGTIHVSENLSAGNDAAAVTFVGCDFHNASSSSGRTVVLEHLDTALFDACTFSLCNGRQFKVATNAENVRISNCIFKMSAGVTGSLIETSASNYFGLEISDCHIPAGVALLAAMPLSGAVIDGMSVGGSAHANAVSGLRTTQTAGVANGADLTCFGMGAGDTILAVTNVTDGVILSPGSFAVETDDFQNNTGSSLVGKAILVSWFDG